MVRKDADNLWDDVRSWLTDATRTAIREAEDLSRRGRLKMEIINLSRKIEKQFCKLGGLTYDRALAEPGSPVDLDGDMKRAVREVTKLQDERSELQRQYEKEKAKKKSRSS